MKKVLCLVVFMVHSHNEYYQHYLKLSFKIVVLLRNKYLTNHQNSERNRE